MSSWKTHRMHHMGYVSQESVAPHRSKTRPSTLPKIVCVKATGREREAWSRTPKSTGFCRTNQVDFIYVAVILKMGAYMSEASQYLTYCGASPCHITMLGRYTPNLLPSLISSFLGAPILRRLDGGGVCSMPAGLLELEGIFASRALCDSLQLLSN